MGHIALALQGAVLVLPCEYHVDCAGWDGKAATVFVTRMTAWDTSRLSVDQELLPGSDVDTVRVQFEAMLRPAGWRYRKVGDTVLVIEGSKQASVRSVEFVGDGWKPAVRWVPVLPPKK